MTALLYSIDDLIVHRPPMRFLDRIVSISETEAFAQTYVRRENPFFSPQGLPAYCGIEMMAQTIAAIDGFKQKSQKLQPKIGFLLGSRRYASKLAYFAEGACLDVHANMIFSDGQMFAFQCRLAESGQEVARANLNVFAPRDPKSSQQQTAQ